MDCEQIRISQVEIPLPSKPPPYRPGDGPPLAPLRIQPEHDTDAFIVDKRVLPGTAPNGELKLHMYYVVGWPDLPAARVSILATQIYDYVSPRAVEDFEYKALLERDEEEERLEAETRRKIEIAAKNKIMTSTSTAPRTLNAPSQKRRGRPSKADLQSRQLAQQASLNTSQNIEVALPTASTSGPSLSTPKKRPAGEIATDIEEDIDEVDQEDAIYKQLCGYNDGSFEDMDMEGDKEDGDIPLDNIPETVSLGSEFRSYARTLWLKDSTLFKRTNGSLTLKPSTSYVPVPEVPRSNRQLPPQSSPTRTDNHPRVTPVPIPQPPFSLNKSMTPSQLSGAKYSTTPVPVPTPLRSNKEVPQPKLKPDTKHVVTPVPVPVPSWPRSTNKRDGSTQAPLPQPATASPEYRGFTPAGRSSGKWPSAQSHSPSDIPSQASLLNEKNSSTTRKESVHSKKKPPKPKPTPQKLEEQPQVWVVERLEGDKMINVDGKHVRYFKVRWEGDWPPDQNPTWEPEENITPALVKLYLKKKAARRTPASPKRRNSNNAPSNTPSFRHPTLKRKYSSVAEAFAGEGEDLGEVGASAAQSDESYTSPGGDYDNADEDDGEEEEMLVVAAEQEASPSRRDPRLRPKPEELGAAFMRDLAAAIRLSDESGSLH
ncbi:hypothetical protein F5Y00DRAFT_222421 [Daldinia vernicosa]|uniref:uncharacterized protein n=1 Tax=Daldinia vernicosa TaxID=114800 RepID=UPI0020085556|nr:uncharacterized protein F5Y00DRAFT_222421 [Daldinia vernicosa]KAI0854151.1 hypothetical protein F5Y00DRAFT_222421 [Daldinia vernicosa]